MMEMPKKNPWPQKQKGMSKCRMKEEILQQVTIMQQLGFKIVQLDLYLILFEVRNALYGFEALTHNFRNQ